MASTDPSTKTDSYAEALRELTRRHEQVLEALAILRQMDEIDDPAESIDVVCRRILETIAFGLACANCSLMLLDEPREFLELRAACSPMEEEARSFAPGVWGGKRFRIGEGVVGRVCESGAPIRIDDVTEDPNFLPIRESQAEVGSLLCFPLRVGGQTIGVLNLSHPEPGFFSVESENTLTLIAERAARIFTSHLLRERLRESEAHYRLVAENAGDGILVSDKHGRVVSANPAIEGISGIRADRYITGEVAWESGIHPEDREKFAESRRTLSTAEESSFVEYRYIDAAGEVHHLEEHSARLLDASRNVTGAVTVARDISERKRAEEERRELEARVQHAQKLESLGILAGGIAHDFNNLLVGILGNASLGLNKTSAASPARQYFEKIEATTRRAAALTNQMLAYSGKGRFVTEAIDLSKLTEEIAHLLEASISKKVSLHHEFEPHLPLVEADPAQLQQIVMNLITNASDAIGDEPGVIALRTRAVDVGPDTLDGTYVHDALSEGRHVALEVSDTGVGMDEETRARVFDPFFTTKFAGRGLGLAAVLGIVRGHHGAIRVQSAPGRGTTITILLPALDADETLPELRRGDRGEEGIGSWQASGTILIADDEEDVREVAKQTLEEYGFDVLTAQDGREAVEVFRAHAGQIDAVLLDMTMPVMGGEEAYRAICEISPRVPVVLSSGFSETEVTGRFGRGEPLTFIQKPFVPSELAATIRSVIEVRPAE